MTRIIFALLLALPISAHAACQLSWDAPLLDSEGLILDPGDINAYRVYVGPRGNVFVKGAPTLEILPVASDADPTTSIPCADVGYNGSKKAVVTAVGSGGESDWSNTIVLKIPREPKDLGQGN